MENNSFEKGRTVVEKYKRFFESLSGYSGLGYTNAEITLYVKPGSIAEAENAIPKELDGMLVSIKEKSIWSF